MIDKKKKKKFEHTEAAVAEAEAPQQERPRRGRPSADREAMQAGAAVAVVELPEAPKVAVSEVPEVPQDRPRRGRPPIDRAVMRETLLNILHDMYPEEVFFTRKMLAGVQVPPSYILYFVEVAKTPVRGLFILPKSWRNNWPGYEEALQSAVKQILG